VKRHNWLILLMLAAMPATAAPGEVMELSPGETATAHALMTGVMVIESERESGTACPFDDLLLHEAGELQTILPAEVRAGLIVQDGWTRPLQVWCSDQHWALISFGDDGQQGSAYVASLPTIDETGDDFLVFDGELVAAPGHVLEAMERGKQRRTMADMRSIGIVFEAYHLDNDAWPSQPVDKLEPIVKIELAVQPIYIRSLPLKDAWGNAFVYWTDGESYRVVSSGKDGVFEADYTVEAGLGEITSDDPARDIVFANGEYEQWPAF